MNGLKCCLRDVKGSDGISMTPEACFIRFGMPEKSCVVYLRIWILWEQTKKNNPDELSQAAKYSPYLEVIFGPEYEVIPVLVLTRAEDLYRYEKFGGTTAEVPVCSGDMLFNVLDEYQGIMKESDER